MSENEEVLVTLCLRPAKYAPRHNRTERMISVIRQGIARRLGVEATEVRISEKLNKFIWSSGGRNYIPRLTVKTKKDEDGVAFVRLPTEVNEAEEAEAKVKEKEIEQKPEELAPSEATEPTEKQAESPEPSEEKTETPAPAEKPKKAKPRPSRKASNTKAKKKKED